MGEYVLESQKHEDLPDWNIFKLGQGCLWLHGQDVQPGLESWSYLITLSLQVHQCSSTDGVWIACDSCMHLKDHLGSFELGNLPGLGLPILAEVGIAWHNWHQT
jgi:hypothetical protein